MNVDSEPAPTVAAARPVGVWRQRNFRAMWSAHTVSQFGTQITFFVVPVLALTTLSASTGQLGLISALETLPFLLFGLPAGALLDRWDRRRVMVAADIGRAAAIALLPIGHLTGLLSIPLLCVVGFAVGLCTVFFDIADQAFLPTVVSREQTADGNSRLEFSRSAAELAGPSLGGLLLQSVAAPLILAVNAVSYLVSALLLGLVRLPRVEVAPPREKTRMRTQIAEGLRFVFRHRTLRALALATGTSNLVGLGGALGVVLTAFALRDLGLSPGELGLALTVGNCGALLGAVLCGKLVELMRPRQGPDRGQVDVGHRRPRPGDGRTDPRAPHPDRDHRHHGVRHHGLQHRPGQPASGRHAHEHAGPDERLRPVRRLGHAPGRRDGRRLPRLGRRDAPHPVADRRDRPPLLPAVVAEQGGPGAAHLPGAARRMTGSAE